MPKIVKDVSNVRFSPLSTDKNTSLLALSCDSSIEITKVMLHESMLSEIPTPTPGTPQFN